MDLLEYAQQLIQQDNTTSQVQAHKVYLQELTKQQPQAEIQPTRINNQVPVKSSNHTFYLVGGLVLLVASVLTIGY